MKAWLISQVPTLAIGVTTSIIGSLVYDRFFWKKQDMPASKMPPRKWLVGTNALSVIYLLLVYYLAFQRWAVSTSIILLIIIAFVIVAATLNALFVYAVKGRYGHWSFAAVSMALLLFLFVDAAIPHYVSIDQDIEPSDSFPLQGVVTDAAKSVYVIVHPVKINTWYLQPQATNANRRWRSTIHLGGAKGDQFEIIALATTDEGLEEIEEIAKTKRIPHHIPRDILLLTK